MTQTTTKQAAIFKAGCYNYHTLIIHLFAQEILGQALQLSYVSLTRLSSHVACESLVCETRNAVFKKKLEKSFVGKLWLQSRVWNEMGGARNWQSWQKAQSQLDVVSAITSIVIDFKLWFDSKDQLKRTIPASGNKATPTNHPCNVSPL